MAEYRIEYLPAAVRALRKLPAEVKRRVVEKIGSLAVNPRPAGR